MKRFIALTAFAVVIAAPAFADPITVSVPKDLSTPEAVAAYKTELDTAVKKVCRRASLPLTGLNYYTFQDCLAETRAEVAKLDPTGLFATDAKKFDVATK